MPASSPATRRGIGRGSTSSRRRCCPEQADLVTEPKVLRLVEVAREAYDLVVIDTSPFFYGPMLALLGPTDQLLLLCGLDVPTLKNVRLSLRTLELLGFPADTHEPRPQPRHAERRPHGRGRRRGTRHARRVRGSQRSGRGAGGQPRHGSVARTRPTPSSRRRWRRSQRRSSRRSRRRRRETSRLQRSTPRLRRFVTRRVLEGRV